MISNLVNTEYLGQFNEDIFEIAEKAIDLAISLLLMSSGDKKLANDASVVAIEQAITILSRYSHVENLPFDDTLKILISLQKNKRW